MHNLLILLRWLIGEDEGAAVRAVGFGNGGEQVLERAADGGQGDQVRRCGQLFFGGGLVSKSGCRAKTSAGCALQIYP